MAQGAHRAQDASGWWPGRMRIIVSGGIITVVALAAGATAWATQHPRHHVAMVNDEPVSATAPTVPLRVVSVSPTADTSSVALDAPLSVTFSGPVAADAQPTLSPAVAGTWTTVGATMTFHPQAGWQPTTTETVSVPAGTAGQGTISPMTSAWQSTFGLAGYDVLRVQQILAELRYLPLTYTNEAAPTTSALALEPTTAAAVSSTQMDGTLTWSYPAVPTTLAATWTPDQDTVMTHGAIMAFEADHGLALDGVVGPKVWSALTTAIAARQVTPRPYDYLIASKGHPETLQVWQDGKIVYSTLSNTGVPGADTEAGTFPVYERFSSTTMTGTNVDGTKYVDKGIPWVAYFNGGDAVHGYVRSDYGFPQSNGCVELPIANAKVVWGMDYYGTLVTVA